MCNFLCVFAPLRLKFLYNRNSITPLILTLLFSILSSCSPSSPEEFLSEGESLTKELITQLQAIHHRDDLIKASADLKKMFNNLVTLMIEADQFAESHPDLDWNAHMEPHSPSVELEAEIKRIYALGGMRELMEKCQEEALHRLDRYLKAKNQRKDAR